MEEKRDTVGKISTELLQKDFGKINVIDQQREMQKEYVENLIKCVEDSKTSFPGDFFVVVETKTEKLMPNVMRNYFFSRWTCPTPNYDQSVFRYSKKDERLEYLWTLPSKDACHHIKLNALNMSKDESQLRDFVLGLFDESLLKLSKQFNNEKDDSIILEAK